MFERILVPLDGSPFAEISLACAEEMAGRMGSQIVLVNVLDSNVARYENLYRCYLEGCSEGLKRRIYESGGQYASVTPLLIKEQTEQDLVCDDQLSLTIGHPGVDIIATAVSHKASLILMATHGFSGFRRLTLGNVADDIIHHCNFPVLLIKPGARASESHDICRNIVVPLDGSTMAEKALDVVEEMAKKLAGQEMRVSLVHVAPEGRKATTIEPSAAFLSRVAHPAWHMKGFKSKLYFAETEEYLKTLGEKLVSSGVNVNGTVCTGKTDEAIARVVTETGATMVVMSSHSRTGLARYVIGSVAERLLRSIDASVLLLRPDKPQPIGAEE